MPLFAGGQTCAQNGIKCIKDAAKVLKHKRNSTPLANLKVRCETGFCTFLYILISYRNSTSRHNAQRTAKPASKRIKFDRSEMFPLYRGESKMLIPSIHSTTQCLSCGHPMISAAK